MVDVMQPLKITSVFGIATGAIFHVDKMPCDILHYDDEAAICTLRILESNKPVQFTRDAFIKGMLTRKIEFLWKRKPVSTQAGAGTRTSHDPRKIPDAHWRIIFVIEQRKLGKSPTRAERISAINRAFEIARRDENVPAKYLRRNKPSIATVYRWVDAWDPEESILSLVPNSFRSGRPKKTLHPVYDEIITFEISQLIETNNEQPADTVAVIEQSLEEARQRNPELQAIAPPGRSAIYRRISELGGEALLALRKGRITAYQDFASSTGSFEAARPLERVEIDVTRLDLINIDTAHTTILPRGYIICMIDVCTRMILAFEVLLTAPCSADVRRLLRKAILPKDPETLRRWNVKSPWPAMGPILAVATDKGKEFIAAATRKAFKDLGIEHIEAPAKSGRHKPYIERFQGTLQRGTTHSSPGTTRSNPKERGERKPDRDILQSIDATEAAIARYICDVYHRREHRSLKCSPLAKWEEMTKLDPVKPMMNEDVLRLITQEEIERRVSNEGIHYEGLRYHSSELDRLFKRIGKPFSTIVRVDPFDLGAVRIIPPGSNYEIEVPCLDINMRGIDLKTHKLLVKMSGISREEDKVAYRQNHAELIRLKRKIAGKRPSAMLPRGYKSKKKSPDVGKQQEFITSVRDVSRDPSYPTEGVCGERKKPSSKVRAETKSADTETPKFEEIDLMVDEMIE